MLRSCENFFVHCCAAHFSWIVAMKTYRLDELAQALCLTLHCSQKKIDQGVANRLSKVIDMDKQGQPESLVWECRLPAGDGGERTVEMLRLPWAILCQTKTVDITMVSIEFDCKVKKIHGKKDNGKASFTATPMSLDRSSKKGTHRIKVCVTDQDKEAWVDINGGTAENFISERLSPDHEQKEQRRKRRNHLISIIILSISCLAVTLVYITYFQ